MTKNKPFDAVETIKKYSPQFFPKVGIILGSGLGHFANHINSSISIPYKDIPGFFQSTVQGHAGNLILGYIENCPVVCLQGRVHLYEGGKSEDIAVLIRTLKLLGCETLLVTNAAGSLRTEMMPGSLMNITDHINFQFMSPLVGENDERFGPRFFSMDQAYDIELQQKLLSTAQSLEIPLFQGTYLGVLGPAFETPAEIRAFRTLGADAVGMSTVAEVLLARHCEMKVAAISVITNLAAGMSTEKLSHEHTLQMAKIAADDLTRLILKFISSLI